MAEWKQIVHGDMPCPVGNQEHHRVGNIRRCGNPAQWYAQPVRVQSAPDHRVRTGLVGPQHPLHGGIGRTGRHHIATDIMVRKLQTQAFREQRRCRL
jgi:hypothetical protein